MKNGREGIRDRFSTRFSSVPGLVPFTRWVRHVWSEKNSQIMASGATTWKAVKYRNGRQSGLASQHDIEHIDHTFVETNFFDAIRII